MDNGIVTSLVSKEQVQDAALKGLIETRFDNSTASLLDTLTRILNLSMKETTLIRWNPHMTESRYTYDLVRCPICHGKTRTRVLADTVLVNFPLFCPKCKETSIVDIRDNRIMLLQRENKTTAELLIRSPAGS